MIIAAHVPVGPQLNVPEALPVPPNYSPNNDGRSAVPLHLHVDLVRSPP